MECVKCGHANVDGSDRCAVCGLDLATIEHTDDGAVHPVYERYIRLRQAAERVAGGGESVEDYQRFLDEISARMAQMEQEIREIDIPPDAVESLKEELEVGFEGIDLYNQSLLHFRQYVSGRDNDRLRSGLELAWAANEKINEARRINRRNRVADEA